jgi:hypothetical protein
MRHRELRPLVLALSLAASLLWTSEARAAKLVVPGATGAYTSDPVHTNSYDVLRLQVACDADCTGTVVIVQQRADPCLPWVTVLTVNDPPTGSVPPPGSSTAETTTGGKIVPWNEWTRVKVTTFVGTGPIRAALTGKLIYQRLGELKTTP